MPLQTSNWHEDFLRKLIERLAADPSPALNVRCLSEKTLFEILGGLEAKDCHLQGSKTQILAWLRQIGLLTTIAVDYPPEKSAERSTRFYSFDVVKSPTSQINPLELLQAYSSDGVICYFTAVAFHSLCTQLPVHHHIAIPTESYVRRTTASVATAPRPATSRNPLGTHLFSHEGIPFYKTSREKRLLPGVQTRVLGPTAVIRITHLEQTLIDTLHRPLHCGGPAVVYEAWSNGLKRMDEDRLADCLASMDCTPIAQRLGYMLEDFDYQPRSKLRSALDQSLAQLDPANTALYQQLFPGLEYHNLRLPWLVYGP